MAPAPARRRAEPDMESASHHLCRSWMVLDAKTTTLPCTLLNSFDQFSIEQYHGVLIEVEACAKLDDSGGSPKLSR